MVVEMLMLCYAARLIYSETEEEPVDRRPVNGSAKNGDAVAVAVGSWDSV